jgi:protein-S-isoprenylcysteine O-methyltransferase Ste14
MKATNWEFTNRALVFGLIFAFTFSCYLFDPKNSTALFANWIESKYGFSADRIAQLVFALAALLLAAAALLRTWASAYLQADVVYAAEVKTQSLVADGPYRRVRNPLYLANVLMAVALGSMMSRTGLLLAVVLMTVSCYRLIMREEAELLAAKGEQYERYLKAVPRLLPSLGPRVPSAGRKPNWAAGFKVELWYWGFVVALLAFAMTLKFVFFIVILVASICLLWISTSAFMKKTNAPQ